MPVVASCQCGARFAAQDHLAGKTVKCPQCAQSLKIPASTATAPSATKTPVTKTPAATAASASPDVGGILDELGVTAVAGVRCPQCSADTPPEAVICVKCGYNLKRGRALKVQSDAALAKKREALEAKKAKAAEKVLKKKIAADSVAVDVAGTVSDLGGVPEASTAILIYPVETFKRLSPNGSTKDAFEYAFTSAIFVGLFFVALYTLFFFMLPLAAILTQPDQSDEIGRRFGELLPLYGKAVGSVAAIYGIFVAMSLLALAPAMAGGAHLILQYVGNSKLSYAATLRVFLYLFGASTVLLALPCLNLFTTIVWFTHSIIALTVHHRVNAGVGLLAVLVSIVTGFFVWLLLNLFLGTAIAALIVMTALPQ